MEVTEARNKLVFVTHCHVTLFLDFIRNNGRERAGLFYHMGDVNDYLSRQSGQEGILTGSTLCAGNLCPLKCSDCMCENLGYQCLDGQTLQTQDY